jgi:putative ABC transport system substrate-binding protein
MKRRGLVAAFTAFAAVPDAARAQTTGPIRIGVLSPFSAAAAQAWHDAFEDALRQLGRSGARSLAIEYRFADGNTARLPDFVAELLRDKVELIVAEVTEASWAAQKATSTIPIVMVAVGDPVGAHLVASLARPGGNITGISQNIIESAGKRLELLKTTMPDLADIAVLWNAEDDNSALNWRELQISSQRLGVRLTSLKARDAGELRKVLAESAGWRALYVVPGPLFVTNLQVIADVAKERRAASIFHLPEYVQLGGLMAYGPDRADLFRRAAVYVDRILKGARPADLPVEQPTKFTLSINLNTARSIGIVIPPSLMARADEVVE